VELEEKEEKKREREREIERFKKTWSETDEGR
jgi:hypothetical protein